MAVVINEFEVVTAPSGGQEGDPSGPPPPSPPPDPARAQEELERALRQLHARAARVHAS
jgi:hypothetical protein